MRWSQLGLAPLVIAVAACANSGANYTPIIDGTLDARYSADLAECQRLAAQQQTVDSSSAGAAAVGAGVAAATTGILDNKGNNVRDAAAVGAILGLTSSALRNTSRQEAIVRNCMSRRGYNVLG